MSMKPETLKESLSLLSQAIPDVNTLNDVLSATLSLIKRTDQGQGEKLERSIFSLQTQVITNVLPVWNPALGERERNLVYRLFVTDQGECNSASALQVALSSYQTLIAALSKPTEESGFILTLLSGLVERFPLENVLLQLLCGNRHSGSLVNLQLTQFIKSVLSIPGKVSNVEGESKASSRTELKVPHNLLDKPFWSGVSRSTEHAIYSLSQMKTRHEATISLFGSLLSRLYNLGLFSSPSDHSIDQSLDRQEGHTTFWSNCLSTVCDRLDAERTKNVEAAGSSYGLLWRDILDDLPSNARNGIIMSLIFHLSYHLPSLRVSSSLDPVPASNVKIAAGYLAVLIGPASPEPDGVCLGTLLPLLTSPNSIFPPRMPLTAESNGSSWDSMAFRCRLIVAYISGGGKQTVTRALDMVMATWGSSQVVKFGLLSKMSFLTLLTILLLSALPPYDPAVLRITFHSPFLVSMQSYLGHSDPAMRRLGMLIGEVVSARSIKPSDIQQHTKSKDELVGELEGMLEDIDDPDAAKSRPPPANVKRLDFGKEMWEGTGQGKEECRWLRTFVGLDDATADMRTGDGMLGWDPQRRLAEVPAETRGSAPVSESQTDAPMDSPPQARVHEVDSDDDSLIGYESSSPSSSRSPSPTPSYLEEIARDPMLNTSMKKKIPRPVYLIQLLDLLRARDDPEKLEVALRWGEELIRRKRNFGTELDENAEELVTQTLVLNDPFDLENFEERRQGILIALTACSPKLVAPSLVNHFFEGEYSLVQRSAILTALAMGARECAGLAPVVPPKQAKIDFPTKYLSPALHKQFASLADATPNGQPMGGLIEAATDTIALEALKRGQGETEKNPGLVRHRHLRVQRDSASQSQPATSAVTTPNQPPTIAFQHIAAEYFILPMLNRFWIYLQEESTRESQSNGRYVMGSTGMILSPISVGQYLSTLSILVHAARHAPSFLAVISPDALELAVTVGSRLAMTPDPLTTRTMSTTSGSSNTPTKEFESTVVLAALELALVSLSSAQELDQGHALALDKPLVLLACAEWAGEVVESQVIRGQAVTVNQGGAREGKIGKAAAGIVVLVSGIIERYQGIMMT